VGSGVGSVLRRFEIMEGIKVEIIKAEDYSSPDPMSHVLTHDNVLVLKYYLEVGGFPAVVTLSITLTGSCNWI